MPDWPSMASSPAEHAAASEPVLLEQLEHGVATLTLNRPRQYNALSKALLEALERELASIA